MELTPTSSLFNSDLLCVEVLPVTDLVDQVPVSQDAVRVYKSESEGCHPSLVSTETITSHYQMGVLSFNL